MLDSLKFIEKAVIYALILKEIKKKNPGKSGKCFRPFLVNERNIINDQSKSFLISIINYDYARGKYHGQLRIDKK